MAQVVGTWHVSAKTRVQTDTSPCWIFGEKSRIRGAFSPALRILLIDVIPGEIHYTFIHSFIHSFVTDSTQTC